MDLLTGLDPERWEGSAVIPAQGWVFDALEARGVKPIVLPSDGRWNVRYLWRIVRTIRELEVDIVQTHLFGAGLYGGLAGALCGVPVVCTFHGEPDLVAGERGARLRYRFLRLGARKVVCVSDSLARSFRRRSGFPPERTAVVHNGIDVGVFRPGRDYELRRDLEVRDDEILVGTVGNFRPAKALDVFVRAAGLLAKMDGRLRFVIVGQRAEPILSQLLRLRSDLGLDGRLELLGFRDDVDRVLRGLDLYVCSSDTEGFSLTTVQAMATGIPVVATRSGGPEDIIRHGTDGVLVDIRSPAQIAEAVRTFVGDPAATRAMVLRARERIEERFSVQAMVDGYEALYHELLA